MESLERRYMTDSAFGALVDVMATHLFRGLFSPTDLEDAVKLTAAIHRGKATFHETSGNSEEIEKEDTT